MPRCTRSLAFDGINQCMLSMYEVRKGPEPSSCALGKVDHQEPKRHDRQHHSLRSPAGGACCVPTLLPLADAVGVGLIQAEE